MAAKQRTVSQVYWLLDRVGPMTPAEMDRHPSADERRRYPLRKFDPLTGFTPVWYLEDHDAERVLRYWLAENRSQLRSRDVSARKLSTVLSGAFETAWQDLRENFPWMLADRSTPDTSEQGEIPCPRCGKEDVKNLPRHLRGCDG